MTVILIVLFCAGWFTFVFLMNYDANSCIIANGKKGCCFFYNQIPGCSDFVYYDAIKPPANPQNSASFFYPEPGSNVSPINYDLT